MVEERNRPTHEDLEDLKDILISQYKKAEDEISGCCRQIIRMTDMVCNQNVKIQAIHNYLWNVDPEFRKLCSIKKDVGEE